ncbi:phenylalanine--tRNA ligase subunit alpha [Salibacter halophilus]|uniref:Phenylalanine--tRNA ligase alpha subunit n=1 Tax=Salibacter halophilus TaxID=1803916 RepID=A0A6N6M9H1_9FLAO|nr:phenylalanine--tRNA ligase subunit alpha [Salibacter halophilus]KAB1063716.1 phenylalanine--tRNA ligase subunit alpha [Salibacter halophilus]
MIEKIDEYLEEIKSFETQSPEELEKFRIRFLGSKGLIKELFGEFKNVPNDQKKAFGQKLNGLKQAAQEKFDSLKSGLASGGSDRKAKEDYTRPGYPFELGARHPISVIRNEIVDIFSRIGFTVAEGPEVEDDWHNFTALNFPEEHPARDMQDTFFVENEGDEKLALRTHTSSVQVRVMENQKPPIRIIAPGRVFRNEAISSRAHCIFHQIEGLYIDENVSFADMKQTLQYFTKEFFGKTKIRLRPSYFPFTEPSAEMDVYWGLETEADYRMTKGTGWLEIMGCGMVDPNVLENCGIDSKKYSGFAFGMGIERIAAQRYGIGDLRYFFENDVRFLKQFKAAY